MKGWFGFLIGSVLILAFMCWYCQYMMDGDNAYHLGHAALYWEKGPLFRPFPWVTYSVISQHNSDLWWGFHVLLSPLTLIPDKVARLAAGPGAMMFLYLIFSAWGLSRFKLNPWLAWAMLLGSIGFVTRMHTIRPQVLSASLLVLLFAGLVTEAPFLALLASVLIGLLHPTLSYMVILVGVGTALSRRFTKGKFEAWIELSCVVLALAAAIVRPGIGDGLALLKVQLVDLMTIRRTGEIPNFGGELQAANTTYFIKAMLAPVLMLVAALFFALRAKREKGALPLLAGLLVSLGAFAISMFITRRGVDQFVPFTILSALLLIRQTGGVNFMAGLLFAGNALFSFGGWVWQHHQRPGKKNAEVLRGASEWLQKNTPKGEIVGQAVWSDFGPLFYWNNHNRYFGGMDPIFQYKFSTRTYWEMTTVAPMRIPGQVGPANPKSLADEKPISEVWPTELKTRWIVAAKTWNRAVHDALNEDPKIKIRYEDINAVVYEILP